MISYGTSHAMIDSLVRLSDHEFVYGDCVGFQVQTWILVKERHREGSGHEKMCRDWVIIDKCEGTTRKKSRKGKEAAGASGNVEGDGTVPSQVLPPPLEPVNNETGLPQGPTLPTEAFTRLVNSSVGQVTPSQTTVQASRATARVAQIAAHAGGTAARTVKGGDPPVESQSVPNVVDVTGASAGRPWELVPVVARWIMQLGTLRSGSRVGDKVRVVAVPSTVTVVVSRGTSAGIALTCKRDRIRAVEIPGRRARAVVRHQRQGCMNCPRTRTRPGRSKRSLVMNFI
ncbi:hypothetical protein F2Q69_00015401 [Brassica cretica]|uniref:Uncharacterized protein n=1 Tax=Brassica cretica TaxID=69181 RepID=A0A8S9QZV3_BRACR|nr:hypothetical protein F2Q69_00015401 [Brassica cretica]